MLILVKQIGWYDASYSPSSFWEALLESSTVCTPEVDQVLSDRHTDILNTLRLDMTPSGNIRIADEVPVKLGSHPVIARVLDTKKKPAAGLDYRLSYDKIRSAAAYMNSYIPAPADRRAYWHFSVSFEFAQFELLYRLENQKRLSRSNLYASLTLITLEDPSSENLLKDWREPTDERESRASPEYISERWLRRLEDQCFGDVNWAQWGRDAGDHERWRLFSSIDDDPFGEGIGESRERAREAAEADSRKLPVPILVEHDFTPKVRVANLVENTSHDDSDIRACPPRETHHSCFWSF